MRIRWALVLALGLGCSLVAQGQTTTTNSLVAGTNNVATRDNSLLPLRDLPMPRLELTQSVDTNSVDYWISKTKVHVTGPLASPLKSQSASDLSHRVLHLFSPFSNVDPNVPPGATGPVNTRAWSTTVGWSPGRSAFPDEHYHEPPQLRLISVSAEKQP